MPRSLASTTREGSGAAPPAPAAAAPPKAAIYWTRAAFFIPGNPLPLVAGASPGGGGLLGGHLADGGEVGADMWGGVGGSTVLLG